MALASMTGFSRFSAETKNARWTWELRSVNGKSLDVRMRLSSGYEGLERKIRDRCAAVLKRGNVSISLNVQKDEAEQKLKVNDQVLNSVLEAIELIQTKAPNLSGASLDSVLAQRGVLENAEAEEDETSLAELNNALITSLDAALLDLVDMRRSEGEKIGSVVKQQVDKIAELVYAAKGLPSRKSEVIRERLKAQVEALLEAFAGQLDVERLSQEAAILATKADIQEELDRLQAHVAATRELIDNGGAVGRRLDFLAQEFNREANTLCSKSNDVSLTSIGLDLKTVIDQMREQIQNLE